MAFQPDEEYHSTCRLDFRLGLKSEIQANDSVGRICGPSDVT